MAAKTSRPPPPDDAKRPTVPPSPTAETLEMPAVNAPPTPPPPSRETAPADEQADAGKKGVGPGVYRYVAPPSERRRKR
jgi:hypothetical protein